VALKIVEEVVRWRGSQKKLFHLRNCTIHLTFFKDTAKNTAKIICMENYSSCNTRITEEAIFRCRLNPTRRVLATWHESTVVPPSVTLMTL
jgi:hypothetical protein